MSLIVPATEDLLSAFVGLRPVVRETPLLESVSLNKATGSRVLVKAESLQRTGSFKFRGAYHRLSRLDREARRRGVVAFSSGNFAQGLAAAGRLQDVAVTIVMPADAPAAKVERTREYGAEVVLSVHGARNREVAADELAHELAEDRGMTLLHPFDDPHIIAGQASVGLEMLEQTLRLGVRLDTLLVPVGGGGLVAGCALAAKSAQPDITVYAVEPEGYDDMARSLESGERERNEASPPTLCDALQAATPGEVTFAAARELLAGGITVDDAEVGAAMRRAFTDLKVVLEPSGATALAALLAHKLDLAGQIVGIVASGGNVALEEFHRITTTVH